MTPDTIIGLLTLSVLFWLEGVIPFYHADSNRYRHAAKNLTLALMAGALGALMAPLLLLSMQFAADQGIGLGNMTGSPPLICAVIALLLFDLWMYAWHRANHEIPFLWRFHRVHHSDTAMDSTTALRFHPGEILFSNLINCLILAALGMSLTTFVLYRAVMLAVILFHHSNLRLPESIDRSLRRIIVSPSLHRVHHSRLRVETDSNYGTIFSFWDRLFGSYRTTPHPEKIRFGIGAYDGPGMQGPLRLLRLPLKPL